VGEGASGRSAFALVDRAAPDVLLLDPEELDFGGPCLIRALLGYRPSTAIVVFAARPGRPVSNAFQAGARGVLLKSDDSEDLVDILRAVGAGGWALSRAACPSGIDLQDEGDDTLLPASVHDDDRRPN
jgi:DNA-binding NarL/FixJ family response regulator